MGIPVWKPKKQQEQQRLQTTLHQHSNAHLHHTSDYRLHRSRQPTLLAEPYYIAADGYTTSSTTSSVSSLSQPPNNAYQRPQRVSASRTRLQLEIESRLEQRFKEKQELLEQLKITTSLLDQFLSIREVSGQHMDLPPFITDDLLMILTATSTTLTSINSTDTNTTTTSPTMDSSINHDLTLPRTPLPRTPSIPMPLRSYGLPDNNASLTSLVDRMIRSPPHASRWSELLSNIASTHRRVCEQLNSLGTSAIESSPNFTTRPMLSFPP